jgi:hypothetical protein
VADERVSAPLLGKRAKLLAQRGLADGGFTDQHGQCAASTRSCFKRCLKLAQLLVSTDEGRTVG